MQIVKFLLLLAQVVIKTSNVVVSRCCFARTARNCSKVRAARVALAARLFFVIQPIKSLICCDAVAFPVVDAKAPFCIFLERLHLKCA